MSIEIEYHVSSNGKCPTHDFIESLPKEAKARTIKTFEMVESFGFIREVPYLRKVVGIKGVWELRVRANTDIYRYYFLVTNNKARIIHCLKKKTNKIPDRDIKTIKRRMGEL